MRAGLRGVTCSCFFILFFSKIWPVLYTIPIWLLPTCQGLDQCNHSQLFPRSFLFAPSCYTGSRASQGRGRRLPLFAACTLSTGCLQASTFAEAALPFCCLWPWGSDYRAQMMGSSPCCLPCPRAGGSSFLPPPSPFLFCFLALPLPHSLLQLSRIPCLHNHRSAGLPGPKLKAVACAVIKTGLSGFIVLSCHPASFVAL